MKNLIIAGIVGAALSVSCSTAKVAQDNRKEFLQLKGDWQITSVNYDKSLQVRPFDDGADAQCFVGSTWHLVPNNYSGTYSLNGGENCPTFTQPIKFEVVGGSTFQFKKINEGEKAKTVTEGYQLSLVDQGENAFTLEQNVPFEGNLVKVVYQFQKVSN
ncbi:lipocalin family protein [Chryseobacterium sp. A301]